MALGVLFSLKGAGLHSNGLSFALISNDREGEALEAMRLPWRQSKVRKGEQKKKAMAETSLCMQLGRVELV